MPQQTRRLKGRGNVLTDLDWMFKNIRGIPTARPAEISARLNFQQYDTARPAPSSSIHC